MIADMQQLMHRNFRLGAADEANRMTHVCKSLIIFKINNTVDDFLDFYWLENIEFAAKYFVSANYSPLKEPSKLISFFPLFLHTLISFAISYLFYLL